MVIFHSYVKLPEGSWCAHYGVQRVFWHDHGPYRGHCCLPMAWLRCRALHIVLWHTVELRIPAPVGIYWWLLNTVHLLSSGIIMGKPSTNWWRISSFRIMVPIINRSILKSLAAFVKIALFDPIGTVYIPMWLCLRRWYLTQSTVVTHHFPSTNTAKTGGYTAHFQVPHANIILLVIYPRCILMISPLSHYIYIFTYSVYI